MGGERVLRSEGRDTMLCFLEVASNTQNCQDAGFIVEDAASGQVISNEVQKGLEGQGESLRLPPQTGERE